MALVQGSASLSILTTSLIVGRKFGSLAVQRILNHVFLDNLSCNFFVKNLDHTLTVIEMS
ncbi:hypothetical protein CCACVL1_11077 [Corchorus capsularis]|uniref:Uncharacterized protein n=1 Tax=Corchorus capsularis TaxID=210143 RepID=A0A1R3IMX1_COCAP|nr:hypothetical protein CCACVL1_11077 [Corchorus capsularis]